jgi:cytochrome d ubiquinol oxidase subunit I
LRQNEVEVFQKSARIGLLVGFVAAVTTAGVGHVQAQVMTDVQPMKMAAAEALWDTTTGADFSLFAVGDVSQGKNKVDVGLPDGLSILAQNDPNATVEGINDVNKDEQAAYGAGDYRPNIPVSYWSFRLMVGIGLVLGVFCFVGLLLLRRGTLAASRWFLMLCIPAMFLPFAGNSIGWIFTEIARQPWVVYGLLRTRDAVSPSVGFSSVLTTLLGFTLLYGVLAVIEFRLLYKYAIAGPPELEPQIGDDEVRPPSLVY